MRQFLDGVTAGEQPDDAAAGLDGFPQGMRQIFVSVPTLRVGTPPGPLRSPWSVCSSSHHTVPTRTDPVSVGIFYGPTLQEFQPYMPFNFSS